MGGGYDLVWLRCTSYNVCSLKRKESICIRRIVIPAFSGSNYTTVGSVYGQGNLLVLRATEITLLIRTRNTAGGEHATWCEGKGLVCKRILHDTLVR